MIHWLLITFVKVWSFDKGRVNMTRTGNYLNCSGGNLKHQGSDLKQVGRDLKRGGDDRKRSGFGYYSCRLSPEAYVPSSKAL